MKKKETLGDQLAWAYFYLTVIATLFMSYLKLAEHWPVSWVWVLAPVWVNLALAFILCGVIYILMRIGANKIIENEKTTYKD